MKQIKYIPAFPTAKITVLAEDRQQPECSSLEWPGMTLRDFFAAKAEGLDGESGLEYAEALAGRKRPDVVHGSPENILEWARFWADADAALRYIKADAMLAAREK